MANKISKNASFSNQNFAVGETVFHKPSKSKMTILKYCYKGSPEQIENMQLVATWQEGNKFKVAKFYQNEFEKFVWQD